MHSTGTKSRWAFSGIISKFESENVSFKNKKTSS
jgi:hypothetical protein